MALKFWAQYLVVVLLSAVYLPLATAGDALTIVYSGNLDGELEPCGCSAEGNLGGIKRRATMIEQQRAKNPDLVLLSAGGLLSAEGPGDRLKGEYILKGFAKLNYDAIGIQWKDFSYGENFIATTKLPFVVSNMQTDKFLTETLIDNNHASFSFFNWLDPNNAPQKDMGQSISHSDPSGILKKLETAKKNKQTTILSTTLSLKQAQKIFPLDNVDILIIKAKYEHYGEVQIVDNTLVLQPGSRGMRLGKVQLVIDNNGAIINSKHEVIPLPPEVKDAERMTDWYVEYNEKVKADYEKRVALRKKLEAGESPFAGEMACQSCHKQQHDKWFETRHAEAFYTLQDANKAFDPACIKCHTVGFEVEGGFIDPAITEKLMHVQCENCHGPAKAHVDTAGQKKTGNHNWRPQQMCEQCHVQKHSPDFNFETYWPKISHSK